MDGDVEAFDVERFEEDLRSLLSVLWGVEWRLSPFESDVVCGLEIIAAH